MGMGAGGVAMGAAGGIELPLSLHWALGAVGGTSASHSISLGASSSGALAFGAASLRVNTLPITRDSRAQWSLAALLGAGYASASHEEGDCGFAIFDDGIEDPYDSCHSVGSADGGLYAGFAAGGLYFVGSWGVGAEARLDAIVGPTPGGAVTLNAVIEIGD